RRTVRKISTQAGSIASFFTVQKKCSVCRTPCASGGVCEDCRKRKASVVDEALVEKRAAAVKAVEAFEQVYSSCQKCQGMTGEVLCMQRDCVQLYDRKDKEAKKNQALADIE